MINELKVGFRQPCRAIYCTVEFEAIGIQMRRKAFTVTSQRRFVERDAEYAGRRAGIQQRLALKIQHLGIAAVCMTLAIFADAIDRRHVTEVFYGSRR